jgi:hypothetical protein
VCVLSIHGVAVAIYAAVTAGTAGTAVDTDRRAMMSLDVSCNNIGQLVRSAGWVFKKGGFFSASKWVHHDGREQKKDPGEPIGAIALATAIRNNGAMRSLNLANNNLGVPEGWRGPDKDGKYKDPRGNYHEAPPEGSSGGVIAVANAIKDMGTLGALTRINVENNNFPANKEEEIYQMARMNKLNIALHDKSLTELDVSGIGFGAEGAKVVAQYISDNGAISSVNLLENNIGPDQAKDLASILKEHPTLKSLCGNRGDETELSMSGKKMGADGAIMLVAEITGNEALTSLDLSGNRIGEVVLADGITYSEGTSGRMLYPGTGTKTTRASGQTLLQAVGLSVLLLLPMPSATWGHCQVSPLVTSRR